MKASVKKYNFCCGNLKMSLIHTFAIQTGIMADTEVKSLASMEFLDKNTELVWVSSHTKTGKGRSPCFLCLFAMWTSRDSVRPLETALPGPETNTQRHCSWCIHMFGTLHKKVNTCNGQGSTRTLMTHYATQSILRHSVVNRDHCCSM